MKVFKILNIITSILFTYLFLLLILSPNSFIEDIGLKPELGTIIILRRAAIFMLGLVVLLLSSMNIKQGESIGVISLASTVTLLGLAIAGGFEFMRGTVDSSIIQAFVFESILGFSYLFVFIANKKDYKSRISG